MKTDNTLHLMSRTKEYADALIVADLKLMGIEGLAPSHGDIMATLFKHDELTMSEIADKISRDRSTVTTLVKKLIKQGLIATRKNEADQRSSFVFLTSEGKEFKEGFIEISEKLYAIQYHGISEQDIQIFRRVLQKMKDNFKKEME